MLIHTSVDDVNDPFSLARLDGDELASEPTRLVEEANTVPLFGGRRAVWVKAGSRNFAPAVEALLGATAPDCRVVIEAGDLRRTAPLRALCERAKNAAALPCYEDREKDLERLIDAEMREAGFTIAPEARAALVPLLGGDRLASRSEISKLALYARGQARVELDDVMAVAADASALALDALIDAAFAGRTADVEFQYAKARTAGTIAEHDPVGRVAQRRVAASGAACGRRRPVGRCSRRRDAHALQPQAAGRGGAAGVDRGAARARDEQLAEAALEARGSRLASQRLFGRFARSAARRQPAAPT